MGWDNLIFSHTLLMYNIKTKDPRTEPWGPPFITVTESDKITMFSYQ